MKPGPCISSSGPSAIQMARPIAQRASHSAVTAGAELGRPAKNGCLSTAASIPRCPPSAPSRALGSFLTRASTSSRARGSMPESGSQRSARSARSRIKNGPGPVKGGAPTSNWAMQQPNDQMSLVKSLALLSIASGDMKFGEPTWCSAFPWPRGKTSGWSVSRAVPKSINRMRLDVCESSRKFSHFRSLCTMPTAWTAARASAICAAYHT
mmetsp:Transcript_134337/g.232171  ORF Transcript_134337/g.232171 Transcript_134337/m.232171 type:complete len:210 (+) Transcript_134337:2-631(+)